MISLYQIEINCNYLFKCKFDRKHEFDLLLMKVRELEDILKSKNRDLYDRINQLNQNKGHDDDKIIVHVNSGKGNR